MTLRCEKGPALPRRHDALQELEEDLAFLRPKGMQEIIFNGCEPGVGGIKHNAAIGCEFNDVPAAVVWISPTDSEAPFFELIEEPHEVARIKAEDIPDILLRHGPTVAHKRQHEKLSVGDVAGLR